MMKIYLLALLFGVSLAGDCTVGEWGPWSDWVSPSCHHDNCCYTSYQQDIQPHVDQGGINHHFMMEHKSALNQETAKCREEGVCSAREGKTQKARVDCIGGLAGEYPCNNIDMLAHVALPDLCQPHCKVASLQLLGADIWGWADAFSGREFALVNIVTGTSFVDVTDPINPAVVAFLPGTGNSFSDWRDVKVIGDYAYIGSLASGHGLQIFDLTQLRDFPTGQPIVEVARTAFFGGFASNRNIVASESSNTIFAVGSNHCSGGLYAVDVSDPLNPSQSGCFSADGYVHDAQCVVYAGPDTNHTGKEICFCFNQDTLTIVDVTDKANMQQLSRTAYAGAQYTHQGWVTEDHELLLLGDEQDEYLDETDKSQRTHLFDITNLTAPVLSTTYTANFFSIDHNQYIVGDYSYQANHQAGLRLMAIERGGPALSEVAYFDVHPESNAAEFNGMWSVYPYFPSGTVVCSSIERGLFVLSVDWPAVSELRASQQTHIERMRFRDVLDATPDSSCPNVVEVEQVLVPRAC